MHAFGGPEVLSLEEITVRDPGPGEVQIGVGAIGLNRIEPGDAVIITAAASSVGLAAIQLVKADGGVPIAVTRALGQPEPAAQGDRVHSRRAGGWTAPAGNRPDIRLVRHRRGVQAPTRKRADRLIGKIVVKTNL